MLAPTIVLVINHSQVKVAQLGTGKKGEGGKSIQQGNIRGKQCVEKNAEKKNRCCGCSG